MKDQSEHVARHYTINDLKGRVLDALKSTHGTLEGLTVADVT